MTFQFRPAIREQTSLLLGIGGPSSSGKTLSALRMARGLVGDDSKIFMIDTEQGRALHYACAPNEAPSEYKFKFQYLRMGAPFSPENYAGAIEAAAKAGAGVIIVDSMSHEHEGQGGILEMHEEVLKRMAGNDYAKRDKMKFTAWIEPKAKHNRLVNTILQQRVHIIFCFRAKDKLTLVKNERTGKIEPVPAGWTAICSDRFEYEMTCLLMLPPNSKGVPDLAAPQTKVQEQHRSFFPTGKSITEDCGRMLAAWANGGAPTIAAPTTPPTSESAPSVYDPETGEVTEAKPTGLTETKATDWANRVIAKFDDVTDASKIDTWLTANQARLADVRAVAPDAAMAVVAAADMRKKQITSTPEEAL